jgi:hypothetical protein
LAITSPTSGGRSVDIVRSRTQATEVFFIADFMDIKGNTINQVKDNEWVCDLAFLVDVTRYLNELNLKLQKQGQLVHELHGHVKAFCNKL